MLMATTFLPLVFNNLPPLIRSHHVWAIIWLLSLLVIQPKIFFSKSMLYVFFYGLLLFIATITIWPNVADWNKKIIFDEFYNILIGISVIAYFLQRPDYIGLAKITRWSLVFLFITAVMTITSSAIDPLYVRNITAISAVAETESQREAILSFKRFGGGNYSTAAAFMCCFPALIFYYKNIGESLLSKKAIIVVSAIIFLALLGMQIFTNIIIAFFFGTLALFRIKKVKHLFLIITLFVTIGVFIPQEVYVNTLYSTSNYFDTYSDINYKFKDLARFIDTGADIDDMRTGTGVRAIRYPILWESFQNNPLLGEFMLSNDSWKGYQEAGGHLYWMGKLATTGIVGLLIFLVIPYTFIKRQFQSFTTDYKYYYLLSSFTILSYGFFKAVGGRDTWYAFFIILPGMYYLPLLKNNENKSGN